MKKTLRILLCLILTASMFAAAFSAAFADENDGLGAAVSEDGTVVSGGAENLPSDTGIIDSSALQTLISDYITQNGIKAENVSVGYCYLATGDEWYYNADAFHYSASLYKVPVSMLAAEKEAAGELTQETEITTTYTGKTTLAALESKSIINSDNYTGHGLVEYLGGTYAGKCADQTIKFTDLSESYFDQSFFDYSYYSAKYYTQVLRTLYNGGEGAFPHVIEYMKQAIPGQYLRLNLEGKYEIAQKYGAYIENSGQGTNNNHAGGIIYTPNPIAVTIMTVDVPNFEKHIGSIAEILADYTLQLDAKLAEYEAARARAEMEAESAAIAKAAEEAAALELAQAQAAAQAQTQTVEATAAPVPVPVQPQKTAKSSFPIVPIIIGLIVLLAAAAVFLFIRGRRLNDYYEDEEYDYTAFGPGKKRSEKENDDDFADDFTDDFSDGFSGGFGRLRGLGSRKEAKREGTGRRESKRSESKRAENKRSENKRPAREDYPEEYPDEYYDKYYSKRSVKSEPEYPEYSEPTYTEPEYKEPEYVKPAYTESKFKATEYTEPKYEQPQFKEPSYKEPEPAYDESVFDDISHDYFTGTGDYDLYNDYAPRSTPKKEQRSGWKTSKGSGYTPKH